MQNSLQEPISRGENARVLCAIVFAIFGVALTGCSTAPMPVALQLARAVRDPAGANQTRPPNWMIPAAQGMDLLYVSNDIGASGLLVFSYPKGDLVGEVAVPSEYPVGLCSNAAGDVFVTTTGSGSQSYVYEYAHAGTQPIATLTDPGEANGCAIDSVTGSRDVAIFPHGQGTASTYFDPAISFYDYCAYDGDGNLYVDGHGASALRSVIGKLPSGSGSFSNITLSQNIQPISMQWTGSSLLVSSLAHVQSKHGPQPIYQIRVSGSSGVVSGPLLLHSPHNLNPYGSVQFWLEGHTLIGPDRDRDGNGLLNFWHYPRAGWPRKTIHHPGAFGLYGVTMSKANQNLHRDRKSQERLQRSRSVSP
jgi:hypothetical protein